MKNVFDIISRFLKTKSCWFYQKKVVVYSKALRHPRFKKCFINENPITGDLEMKKKLQKATQI